MSGWHGHDDHGHGWWSAKKWWPSVTKWAANTMGGMVGFLFTGLFSGNDGWHDHHH